MSINTPFALVALRIDWQHVMRFSLTEISNGLPAERVSRIPRILRLEDQYRCVFAGHLINFLYRRMRPGQSPPSLTTGAHGKPKFTDPSAPKFNISHSGDWVVGIAGEGPLGIDVEEINPRTVVLNDVLSPAERHDLEAIPAPYKGRYFIRLWTLKEAHLKAEGVGLVAGSPARLSFRIDDEGTATLAGQTGQLLHQSILLDKHHAYATCTPQRRPPLPSVVGISEILAAHSTVR